jgi:hypothetical protein
MLTADFFWVCAKEAAKSTISWANAWFWVVGLPIVGAAFWFLDDLAPTEIPENLDEIPSALPDFIIFMGETIVVTWIVFFSFRLFGAPARVWLREVKENERLSAVLANQKRRVQLKSLLGSAIVSGEKLLRESDGDAVNPESIEQEVLFWADRTKKLISSAFGSGEGVLFLNSSGYPVLVSPNKLAQIRLFVDCRLKRLVELIPRAETLPIDEGFSALPLDSDSKTEDELCKIRKQSASDAVSLPSERLAFSHANSSSREMGDLG